MQLRAARARAEAAEEATKAARREKRKRDAEKKREALLQPELGAKEDAQTGEGHVKKMRTRGGAKTAAQRKGPK